MESRFSITVFHNPGCGTSRAVLQSLHDAGYQPEVVAYLQTGWSAGQLEQLFTAMGVGAHAMLRTREALVAELGLLEPGVTEHRVLDAMLAHPVLVERPIVATELGVVLARPAERVRAVLPGGAG